jgi:hypothetical protein
MGMLRKYHWRQLAFKLALVTSLVLVLPALQSDQGTTVSSAQGAPSTNLTDTTVSDFSACTVPAGLAVTNSGDGELRLAAGLEDYFNQPPAAATWLSGTWNGSTYSPTPVAGILPIQNSSGSAWLRSTSTFSQVTLDGRVSFGSGQWEHFGFGDDGFNSRFAILSTANNNAGVWARTWNGQGGETRTNLNGVTLNAYHTVQIVWSATSVAYIVDGTQVASHSVAIAQPMYAYLSNNSSAGTLNADWVRVNTYSATSAAYTSCTKDAGSSVTWGNLTAQTTTPAGTSVVFQTRTSPDGVTYSPWTNLSGTQITSPAGRFIQYTATLNGTTRLSPEVQQVTVGAASPPTSTPTATPTATNTPLPTSTSTATPTATATPLPVSTSLTDTTVADFGACGLPAGMTISTLANGEVRLAAAFEDYFSQAPTAQNWLWGAWDGTSFTPTASAGILPVQNGLAGAWLRSTPGVSQQTLEGRGSFGSGAWEHFGLADDGFAGRYALFSTANDAAGIYTRTESGSGETRTLLPGVSLDEFHDFQIVWTATSVTYIVDGDPMQTDPITGANPMYVYLSNNATTGTLNADWVRVASYPATNATFTSCIKDGGTTANWSQLQWHGVTPAGTSATFLTRTSNDGLTWSAYAALNNGQITSPAGRYLQYQIVLSGAAQTSPQVDDVTLVSTAVPTNTPVPTATSTPSVTATPTVTNTPQPGPTNTPTITPTATNTSVPTSTSTPTPTNTPPPPPTSTPAPTSTPVPSVLLVGDMNIESNLDDNAQGISEAFLYTAAASGTVTRLSIYLAPNSSSTQLQLGLYSNNAANDTPATLLTQGTILTPTNGIWNSIGVNPVSVTSGTKYWLALLSTAGQVRFRSTAPGGKAVASTQTNLSALTTTFSPGGVWMNSPASMYAIHDSSSAVPPALSSIAAVNVTDSGATITWTTDIASTSQVNYGPTTSYASTTALDPAQVINHSVVLSNLNANSTYHYRVRSTDAAGNQAISGDFTFSTPAITPPTNPILVVVDPASPSPFGAYVGELLRAEGINSFQTAAPSNVTAAYLGNFPMVILPRTSTLTSAQVTMYTQYVTNGGTLIALRPDPQLASLFGLTTASGTTSEGYLLVDSTNPISGGIVNQTIQFHGAADRYALNGATSLATLYSSATAQTNNPAVVTNTVGSGRTAAFTFDLAQSVAYTRQGNPATAGTAYTDGIIRTISAFTGGWVSLDRMLVPQADEQQRLLANIIVAYAQQTTPIPRIWYFPGAGQTSVLVPTGDDHGQVDSVYQNFANVIEQSGGRFSFYVSRFGPLTAATQQNLVSRGHEVTIHPYAQADSQTIDQGLAAAISWFQGRFGVTATQTVRNHQLAWQGWADGAKVAQNYGIRMDTSFYTWGTWLQKTNGQWVCDGYPTGSGLPMKFVDQTGAIIPVYQQVTQLVDEHMLSGAGNGYCGLTEAAGATLARQLIDQATGGFYSAITMQAHTDYGKTTWLASVTSYAQSKGMPIWTTQRWLNFTQSRHDAVVDQFAWNAASHQLTFRYRASTTEPSTTVLLPATWQSNAITSSTVDGAGAATSSVVVKGITYRAVTVPSGTHTVVIQYAP